MSELPPHPNLEYLRRLYENVLEWHERSARTAQLLLTLDGLIITVATANLAGDSALRGPGALVMGLFLIMSVYCAVESLFGHLGDSKLETIHAQFGVEPEQPTTFTPEIAWWFGTIASVSQDKSARRRQAREESLYGLLLSSPGRLFSLLRRPRRGQAPDTSAPAYPVASPRNRMMAYLLTADTSTERQALASEIVVLSQHILMNYRWLNRGWVFAGLGLVAAVVAWL